MKQKARRVSAGFLRQIFTPQERTAVVFLLAVGFLGLGIRAFQTGAAGFGAGAPGLERQAVPWQVVSVNRAGVAEITALPGIGPVTARRIAEHRRLRGRFLTLTDLKRVKGITPRTLERLKGHLRFD